MRNLILTLLLGASALGAAALGGCSYFPVPPDPIRVDTSPAEVSTCRRLGHVGIARTDGVGGINIGALTVAVPAYAAPQPAYGPYGAYPQGNEIQGPNFAVRFNAMRDGALALGATDLLITRVMYRDYSYVEGTAYRCRWPVPGGPGY